MPWGRIIRAQDKTQDGMARDILGPTLVRSQDYSTVPPKYKIYGKLGKTAKQFTFFVCKIKIKSNCINFLKLSPSFLFSLKIHLAFCSMYEKTNCFLAC